MKPKMAIIGKGNVGSALKRGLERAGYAVRSTGKEEVKEIATWGEVVIIGVPFTAMNAVVQRLGNAIEKKVVMDVTNALEHREMQLALGFSTSGGEELQKKVPNARIVKAFNTVFAQHMDTGRVLDQKLTLFAVSDDQEARSIVLDMGRALGFDAVDAGPLSNAGQLESLGTSISSWGTCWAMAPTRVSSSFTDAIRCHGHRPVSHLVLIAWGRPLAVRGGNEKAVCKNSTRVQTDSWHAARQTESHSSDFWALGRARVRVQHGQVSAYDL